MTMQETLDHFAIELEHFARQLRAGIGLYIGGHKAGMNEGFEAGRFAEHEYAGGKMLADSCYEWAALYDKDKPGNTDHVKKSCDSMMSTARSWVGNKSMEGMAGIY